MHVFLLLFRTNSNPVPIPRALQRCWTPAPGGPPSPPAASPSPSSSSCSPPSPAGCRARSSRSSRCDFLKKNYFFVHTRCFPKSIVAVMSSHAHPLPPHFSLEKKFPSEKESPQKRIFMQIVYCHIVNNPIFVLRLKYCEEIVRTILHVVRHVRNNKQ